MNQPRMDKAVILARGLGTRMRRTDGAAGLDDQQAAVAETGVKALIPVGRPFLDYGLSALADAGFGRVCLVVAPDHDDIRRYYEEEVQPRRIRIEYAVQEEPKGTADAVAAAEAFADGDPVLVVNSDNYYPVKALGELRELAGSGVAMFDRESMIRDGNIEAERVYSFSVGKFTAQGFLAEILEKPDKETLASLPQPLWLNMNCWRFTPPIFEACRNIKLSPRGELELPDAVQYMIDVLGEPFEVVKVQAAVLDLTSRQDVAAVAAKLAHVEVSL